ncbi:MAG TPA: response regulator [Rhodanobacteraceae bacterium]|nr:response regulator [Rhodanobacteraceae bacterium]
MSEAFDPGERANVLLVDDHPARLLSYRAILDPLGENLIEVASGTDALRNVMDTDFAVILLDVNMPEMDGFETASLIHQHPRFEKTPIIFVSAVNVTDMDRLRGYKLGAVDYVMVPIIPEILRGKVAVLCELFRKRRELQRLNDSLADTNAQLARTYEALKVEREREVHKLNQALTESNIKLATSNRELKSEVLERRRIEERLREADRRKDEFLATLAHELRNPLAPIQGALNVQRLERAGKPGGDDTLYTIVDRQTRQLVRMVDDLLDVSRITRGRLDLRLERAELREILAGAVETAKPLIDEGNHPLELDLPEEPVVLQADPHRLTQVFGNLLNNACKFSDPGGVIGVKVTVAGDSVEVAIRDAGLGLTSEQVQFIFELFAQADTSLERPHSGLGIGLTLSRRLIEMHGGQIAASSDGLGEGSTFTVTLPLHAAAAAPEPAPAAPAPAAPQLQPGVGLRVMVVDDNRDSADMLAMSLKIMGHEVRTLYDPLAVLGACAEFEPQLMIMDVGMPELNGFALAERLRARAWRVQPPRLVALTGWGQHEDRRRSLEAGFADHLVKPANLETIERVCSDALAYWQANSPPPPEEESSNP